MKTEAEVRAAYDTLNRVMNVAGGVPDEFLQITRGELCALAFVLGIEKRGDALAEHLRRITPLLDEVGA